MTVAYSPIERFISSETFSVNHPSRVVLGELVPLDWCSLGRTSKKMGSALKAAWNDLAEAFDSPSNAPSEVMHQIVRVITPFDSMKFSLRLFRYLGEDIKVSPVVVQRILWYSEPLTVSQLCRLKSLQDAISTLDLWGKVKQNLLVLDKPGCSKDADLVARAGGFSSWIDQNKERLSVLKTLSCIYGELFSIPVALGKLVALNSLLLSNNRITSIPDEVGDLSNLTMLYLQHNRLKRLPETLTKLTNLEILDLFHNQLEGLPKGMGALLKLQHLDLRQNPMTEGIPQEVEELVSKSNAKNPDRT